MDGGVKSRLSLLVSLRLLTCLTLEHQNDFIYPLSKLMDYIFAAKSGLQANFKTKNLEVPCQGTCGTAGLLSVTLLGIS